ncbi:MAG: hypothetical protein A2428_00565 [Bdellovibrionales bacterium RIFOXYC1_FULL_54_43]|nr:MAG: hypothetical protein A2428_00565 [Bdellovibrionales bacterium RIFOXYC1_FULL_54_43]OFZ82480.1 MAG: hypothetical protein A2603_15540 [Bdellovibrionales bacterium RIFOXYD1_FULL_55_31]
MLNIIKRPKLVGEFIRKRRSALGLSQRALGMLFNPPVTTQFISNVERGVTPLPPVHIPTLSKALAIGDAELTTLLEREFTMKLSGRLGKTEISGAQLASSHLTVDSPDYDFMRSLYNAYQRADEKTRQTFADICENVLNVPKSTS